MDEMNRYRIIYACAAAVQFSSLILLVHANTRILGLVSGMIMGSVLLLSALDLPRHSQLDNRDES